MQSPQSVKDAVSVANNACWAIGELAIKVSAYFYTFWLNPHAPNSFSRHKIPSVLLLLKLKLFSIMGTCTYKLLCTGLPQSSFPCVPLVMFLTHIWLIFLFPDWQRNRTCGDLCCFLLGSYSKISRGEWLLRSLVSCYHVRFELNS